MNLTAAAANAAASSHNRPLQLGIAYTRHHRSVRQPNDVHIVIQSQMDVAGGGRGDRVHQIRYTWMMNTTDELTRRLRSCAATLERPSVEEGLPPFIFFGTSSSIFHPQSTTRCC